MADTQKKAFQCSNILVNVVATLLLAVLFILGPGFGCFTQSKTAISEAQAAGGVVEGPNVIAPDRYVYYPGTEVLAKNEVRVIACGIIAVKAPADSTQSHLQTKSPWGQKL